MRRNENQPGQEHSPSRKVLKGVSIFGYAFIGGLLGLFVVRLFFLDALEVMGFDVFWKRLMLGEQISMEFVRVSIAFWQLGVGFIVGAVLGGWAGLQFIKRYVSE